MKKVKFETSKGDFLVVDLNTDKALYELQELFGYSLTTAKLFIKLSDITEEQASEVVDEPEYIPCYNCLNGCPVCGGYGYSISWVNELHSLLKSKGIHLYENPIEVPTHKSNNIKEVTDALREEQKTFYNPYIFKVV